MSARDPHAVYRLYAGDGHRREDVDRLGMTPERENLDSLISAEPITACRRCGRPAWQVEADRVAWGLPASVCQPHIGPRTHDWWTGPRREWFAR